MSHKKTYLATPFEPKFSQWINPPKSRKNCAYIFNFRIWFPHNPLNISSILILQKIVSLLSSEKKKKLSEMRFYCIILVGRKAIDYRLSSLFMHKIKWIYLSFLSFLFKDLLKFSTFPFVFIADSDFCSPFLVGRLHFSAM